MARTSIPKLPWTEARPERVVLVTGPETYFADRAWRVIRDGMRQQDPAVEVHDIDASVYAGGELFTLASPSLFGEPRLIRVEAVEKSSDAFIEDAKRYLAAPDDDTTLVIRHGGGMRGKAVLDLIRKGAGNGIEIECPEVKPRDRLHLVLDEFRRRNLSVDGDAARALTDAFQGDLEELMAALAQVAGHAQGRVTLADVEGVTGGRVEADAFKVADAALRGNATLALVLLRQSLATGHAPMHILAGVNYKIRAMARVYGQYGSAAELAKRVGAAPWQVQRSLDEVRGWTEADLARVVDEAAETEKNIKGGARNPEYALERLILLLARRGKRTAGPMR